MPILGKKTIKIFLSGTKSSMTLKLGMQHWVLRYYQNCSNDDPGLTSNDDPGLTSNDDSGLTLTYFTARSNLLFLCFYMRKGLN